MSRRHILLFVVAIACGVCLGVAVQDVFLERETPTDDTELEPRLSHAAVVGDPPRAVDAGGAKEPRDQGTRTRSAMETAQEHVDLFELEAGQLFSLHEVSREQRDQVQEFLVLQAKVCGFDADRASLLRGDDRGIAALVFRDPVTWEQVEPPGRQAELLRELGELHADVLYYQREHFERLVDRADSVYRSREEAKLAKESDARYARHRVRKGRGGFVLITGGRGLRDPDVVRCNERIRNLDYRLGVHSDAHWYGMPGQE